MTTSPSTRSTSRSAGHCATPQMFWGGPAPRSWLAHGSTFHDAVLRDPTFNADVIVAN